MAKGRKSVSFENYVGGDTSDSDARPEPVVVEKQPPVTTPGKSVVPQVNNSSALIPFHNLYIIWQMFQMGLTENIEGTLTSGLLILLPLQLIYNYLIISQMILTKKASKNLNVPLLIVSSVLVSIIFAGPLFVIIILMGAPIYKFTIKSFLLSLHLSQLIINPICILYTLDFENFKKLFYQDYIYREIFSNVILSSCLLSVGGCWLGVIPIPLDWDRPWQQWPLTLLVGGYVGGVIGGVISIIVRKLRKFD
ncbi:Glycosylphosphatidylinositol anchor biosynthesis protein 11 [Spathaspora sp. JA1]|nr:Glycosylphosphatidylinositol anchor biosynthesis protein 11 [Spathaspora sp. JA1]